jgi:hypothetical protein
LLRSSAHFLTLPEFCRPCQDLFYRLLFGSRFEKLAAGARLGCLAAACSPSLVRRQECILSAQNLKDRHPYLFTEEVKGPALKALCCREVRSGRITFWAPRRRRRTLWLRLFSSSIKSNLKQSLSNQLLVNYLLFTGSATVPASTVIPLFGEKLKAHPARFTLAQPFQPYQRLPFPAIPPVCRQKITAT